MSVPAPGGDRFAAFRHAHFRHYWLARICSTFGVQILSVAVGWQVYDLTRDPLDLGIIGLVQFLPALLLVLVTGAAADRLGRKRMMMASVALQAVGSTIVLWFAWTGLTSPVPVFVALAGIGVARAFYGPAAQALVVNVVPTGDFPNAVSWNSTAWQIAHILGPVTGGLLYGIGAEVAYTASVGMSLAALMLLRKIPHPQRAEHAATIDLGYVFDGLRFIRREKVVFGAISLDLFAVLLGGAVALLPVYARDILELGPTGLGLLRAAPGIGAVLVAVWLAGHPVRDHAGRILLFVVGLFGLFTVIFGVSTIAWVSILALALIGAADMVSVVIREVLIQLWTPDALRGRVNAVNLVFLGASNELGEFRAGVMAAWIGVVPAVVFGGVGAVLVAIGWVWLFPQMRDVRALERSKPP